MHIYVWYIYSLIHMNCSPLSKNQTWPYPWNYMLHYVYCISLLSLDHFILHAGSTLPPLPAEGETEVHFFLDFCFLYIYYRHFSLISNKIHSLSGNIFKSTSNVEKIFHGFPLDLYEEIFLMYCASENINNSVFVGKGGGYF